MEEKSFVELVKENPTLKIIPLVDTEVVGGDEFTSWYGAFNGARLTEMAKVKSFGWYGRTTVFKDDLDEYEEAVIDSWSINDESLSDEDLKRKYEEHIKTLKWVNVIVAYIGLPEI